MDSGTLFLINALYFIFIFLLAAVSIYNYGIGQFLAVSLLVFVTVIFTIYVIFVNDEERYINIANDEKNASVSRQLGKPFPAPVDLMKKANAESLNVKEKFDAQTSSLNEIN
jgi:hypothetical protein